MIIEAENDFLKLRVKELAPEKTEGTHFTDAHMDRRLKIYRETNANVEAESHISQFFTKVIGGENCMLLDGDSTVDEAKTL